MLNIKIGLVKIPVMLVNLVNSRYAETGLHQFSSCCKSKIKHDKVCSKCGEKVSNAEVLKGLDEKTILTREQQEELKTLLDNGYMEVISIKQATEELSLEVLPFARDTKLVLPSISKGFRKEDIKTFYSFFSALNEMNSYCVVKYIQRGTEHLGILRIQNGELLYTEIPFKHYQNTAEVKRLKEAVVNTIDAEKIKDLEEYKNEAKEFLKGVDNKKNFTEVTEEKRVLLKSYIEEIRNGTLKEIIKKPEKVKLNPFAK